MMLGGGGGKKSAWWNIILIGIHNAYIHFSEDPPTVWRAKHTPFYYTIFKLSWVILDLLDTVHLHFLILNPSWNHNYSKSRPWCLRAPQWLLRRLWANSRPVQCKELLMSARLSSAMGLSWVLESHCCTVLELLCTLLKPHLIHIYISIIICKYTYIHTCVHT